MAESSGNVELVVYGLLAVGGAIWSLIRWIASLKHAGQERPSAPVPVEVVKAAPSLLRRREKNGESRIAPEPPAVAAEESAAAAEGPVLLQEGSENAVALLRRHASTAVALQEILAPPKALR